MNINLKGKRALVCGSTQGIGKATALMLAEMGADITLMARNEEKLREVIKELSEIRNGNDDYVVADFSDPDGVSDTINEYISGGRTVHILVNNTGGPPAGPVLSAEKDAFKSAFGMHLLCNHLLAQAVIPGMKEEGYGRVINIISTSVKEPIPGLGVSNTIRGAVANWSKTLAREVAPFSITVNNVLPGATSTERLTSIIKNKASKNSSSEDAEEQAMKNKIPAGRFADAKEIASAVAFLSSPAASYITGTNMPVDGGRTGCL